MSARPGSWACQMAQAYDLYFGSHFYDERYPAPNASTLAFLCHHGADRARHVLDLGCGNGRYAIALLGLGGGGRLVGCDISRAALADFRERMRHLPQRDRVVLVEGGPEALPPGPPFDCILMLFGVLGHIGPRAERVAALRALRDRSSPDTVLLLSVPSVWRRMPAALLRSVGGRLASPGGDAAPDAWADIEYRRVIHGTPVRFFYHLYRTRTLRAELAEAGWRLEEVEAESVLPEKLVCRRSWAASLDRVLRRWVPASLGYGIRGVARACGPRGTVAEGR